MADAYLEQLDSFEHPESPLGQLLVEILTDKAAEHHREKRRREADELLDILAALRDLNLKEAKALENLKPKYRAFILQTIKPVFAEAKEAQDPFFYLGALRPAMKLLEMPQSEFA